MKTKNLMRRLFSQPTAPFREGWVLREIAAILQENHIPYFHDACGNIVAGVASPRTLSSRKPRLALQAHTDHPGFHLIEPVGPQRWQAMWYGGAPFRHMKGARLHVYSPHEPGRVAQARVERMDLGTYTREGMPMVIRLTEPAEWLNASSFGAFAFPAWQMRGDQIRTRVADDLAGVVIALGALIDQKKSPHALAVFTRAEEVGFVGCWHLMQKRVLPKSTWMLCLEASRELEMARMGQGPVLRLGDRSTVYDSDFSIWMWKVAEELKQKSRFRYQRRLMDGGSCEATAMSLHGYTTSGLAVPLRNYHNQGPKSPQPEIISLKDVEGARVLCAELFRNFAKRPQNRRDLQKSLNQNYTSLRRLLRAQVDYKEGRP